MRKNLSIAVCLGLAALLVRGNLVDAQTGPVREGLRRTGEAVTDGARAAVRGTGQAIGQAGQAVRDSVNSPADAARAQVDHGERSELEVRGSEPMLDPTAEASVRANAGPAQVQTDASLNENQQLDADGQIQAQSNDPALKNQYQSGFRGVEDQSNVQQPMSGGFEHGSQVDHNGRMYNVRISHDGRPYICVGGCPVYLDQEPDSVQQHQAYRMSDDSVQYNGIHQGREPMQGDQQDQNRQDHLQGSTYLQQEEYAPVPAPPGPPTARVRGDIDAGNRNLDANSGITTDQGIRAVEDPSRSGSADIDAEADADAIIQQQRTDLNATEETRASAAEDSASDQNQDSNADQSEDANESPSDSTSSDSSDSGT